MAPPDRRPAISTVSRGVAVTPPDFAWPVDTPVAQYSSGELADTASWVSLTHPGQGMLHIYRDMPANRDLYLSWVRSHALTEEQRVRQLSLGNRGRVISPLRDGSWSLQENKRGINTCVIASGINALKLLNAYDPRMHTEERFLDVLAARGIVVFQEGISANDFASVLAEMAPEVSVRGSNSVSEMIEAAERGAAVLFPASPAHEALIPPGHRLRLSPSGELEVQYADPMAWTPRFKSVSTLIKSQISASPFGDFSNAVAILEKPRRRITTIVRGRTPIRTIDFGRPPIRTIR